MTRKLPGKRVLIVEDNPVLAYDMSDLMKENDAEPVGPALDLENGLELARENTLDAALLDINLGNGDLVWPLAEKLRQQNVPLVFVSGECTKKYFPASFQDFVCLEKPASNDAIWNELKAAWAA